MQANEQVEKIANMLLPGFIPKDDTVDELTFHFTTPPNNNFKVWYEKKENAKWVFIKYEAVER